MKLIIDKLKRIILFASFFTILIIIDSGRVLANEMILIPKGYLDTPTNGSTVKGDIVVNGWFLDGSGVSKIEVLVDGKSMGEAQYGIARSDVGEVFPDYQNENSGYQFNLNTKNLTNGQHRLTVRETGVNGATNELKGILMNVQNLAAKGYLDSPGNGSTVKGETNVRGWFLDGSGVSKIEVLVDGKNMGEAQLGNPRSDVGNAFPEYQNTNSGYQFSLNTINLTNGLHRLTVKETGNNGTINELESIMVNVQNFQSLPARGYLDTPTNGSTIKGEMVVKGWYLDGSGVSKIEVLVDGKSMGEAQYGIARSDVAKTFPEYNNDNSGYYFTLNTMNIPNGQHRLIVRETGKNGASNELESILVNVQNSPVKGYLDNLTNGSTLKGEIVIEGWYLDISGVSKIEVLVDGKSMGEAQYGIARTDVGKAFPEYQNTNSGFRFALDTKNLANGQHRITVRETGNNSVKNELGIVLVNVQNPPVKGYLDTPNNGSTVKGEILVKGWYLDISGVSKIEVLVDGKSMGEAQYGIARTDVGKAFPEYQNGNPGYLFTLNTKNLTNGQHKLAIRETGQNGTTNNLETIVLNVQNPPAIGYIDSPANGSTGKGDINVTGWYLDGSGVSKIEVFVDGKSKGVAQYGSARPDVNNAFPEYENKNSGYQLTFNSTQFADGQHTLTVKGIGQNGATYTLNSIINTFNGSHYKRIDLRKPSTITANDIVNFFNKKRPDSPLKNFAQSFIDAQNKYGVNAQYLVAHAIWETGWGGSNLKTYKNNLFGYGAYDACPFTCGYYFPTGADSINYEAYIVRRDYLNENGTYFNGPTLIGMNVRYATDQNWSNGIANLMESIKPYDESYYSNTGTLPGSSVVAPSFGRNIPVGQPYPTSIIINFTTETYATVSTNNLSFRSIPYSQTSTLIKTLGSGKVVKVIGYNTDVKYVPGDASQYPYDNRWYRVIVDGQEGWLYGGGITFN